MGGAGELKLTARSGEVLTLPLAEWDIRFDAQEIEVRARGLSQPEVSKEHDARRLARTVLEGDTEAALLLADEVRERHLEPEGFVSRDALKERGDKALALLREWWQFAANYSLRGAPNAPIDATQDLLDKERMR